MSNNNINKLCSLIKNSDGTFSRPSSCSLIPYNKLKTSGNDPTISGKLRYAQYVRNAKPDVNRQNYFALPVVRENKWRDDFFIDEFGDCYVSFIVKHIPDFHFFQNYSLLRIYFEGPGLETAGISSFSESNIQSVDFPNTLYLLKHSAFQGCLQLTNINLSTLLIEILDYTFANCKSLVNVDSVSNVINIHQYAFFNCYQLTSFDNLSSLIEIHNNAFQNCTSLKTLNYDLSKLLVLGDESFRGCISIESFTFPNNIIDLSNGILQDCVSLIDVSFNSNLNSIGERVFKNCSNLLNIIFPNSLKLIGNNLFENSGITDISFSINLENISDYCFSNCLNLENIFLTDNIKYIGKHAFEHCINLISLKNNIIDNIQSSFSKLEIIDDYAFFNCVKLTNLDSLYFNNFVIKTIGNYTFSNCSSLQYFIFPNTVTSIGNNIFDNCNNLEFVELNNNITTVPNEAFKNCNSLLSVVFKEGLLNINNSSFINCNSLNILDFPESLINIGESAFENCITLSSVTLKENIEQIQDRCFYNCRRLRTIDSYRLTKLKHIGKYAFYINKFSYFYIPTTLKTISEYSFSRTSIEQIDFEKDSVTSIENNAFEYCSKLDEIIFPDSLLSIGTDAFKYNRNLNNVYFYSNAATSLNLTNGFNLPFFGTNTNINFLDNISLPILIESIPDTIDPNIIVNNIYLRFTQNVNYLLSNKISISIRKGNIINNESFLTIDNNTPFYFPYKKDDFNNLSEQVWCYPNFSINAFNNVLVAKIKSTRNTFGDLNFQYSDSTRDDYIDNDFKFIYGRLYKIIPINNVTNQTIYDPISLPLIIEWSNIIINGITYVVNTFYLKFNELDKFYSNKLTTNINGTVFQYNSGSHLSNLEQHNSKFTINGETPIILPNHNPPYNWNNFNNKIWFLPNKYVVPNMKNEILKITLSYDSTGNINYSYSDNTRSNFKNFNFSIINGYIGIDLNQISNLT
tara:strand:+ start:15444 stop:18350 length:2907 start_codon:yes stop_codon:yes gene_type:complete